MKKKYSSRSRIRDFETHFNAYPRRHLSDAIKIVVRSFDQRISFNFADNHFRTKEDTIDLLLESIEIVKELK